MDLIDAIKARRAIRKYKPDPVPEELIKKVFETAKWSPIPHFFRIHKYFILTGEKRDKVVELVSRTTLYIEEIIKAGDHEFKQKVLDYSSDMGGAPVLLIAAAPKVDHLNIDNLLQVAVSHESMLILLSAYNLGLATCGMTISPWITDRVKEEAGIPAEFNIILSLVMGYPDEQPEPPLHPDAEIIFINS